MTRRGLTGASRRLEAREYPRRKELWEGQTGLVVSRRFGSLGDQEGLYEERPKEGAINSPSVSSEAFFLHGQVAMRLSRA